MHFVGLIYERNDNSKEKFFHPRLACITDSTKNAKQSTSLRVTQLQDRSTFASATPRFNHILGRLLNLAAEVNCCARMMPPEKLNSIRGSAKHENGTFATRKAMHQFSSNVVASTTLAQN
jgi:hypothetical protein